MPKDPRLYAQDQRDLSSDIVTLAVGQQQEEFYVHEDLLRKHSAFFDSAAKKEWKEGQERRVSLPDDTPSVVNLYAQWLYCDKILSRKSPDQEDDKNTAESKLLVNAFIFGEKVQNDHFKDALIDALIHLVVTPDKNGGKWYPSATLVDRAYQGTPEGSPLRKLLVDMQVHNGNSNWLNEQKNVDFLNDLARRLLDNKENPERRDPTQPCVSSCQYHHHSRDDDCYGARPAKRARREE